MPDLNLSTDFMHRALGDMQRAQPRIGQLGEENLRGILKIGPACGQVRPQFVHRCTKPYRGLKAPSSRFIEVSSLKRPAKLNDAEAYTQVERYPKPDRIHCASSV